MTHSLTTANSQMYSLALGTQTEPHTEEGLWIYTSGPTQSEDF